MKGTTKIKKKIENAKGKIEEENEEIKDKIKKRSEKIKSDSATTEINTTGRRKKFLTAGCAFI